MLFPLFFILTIHDLIHWFIVVGICVSIVKSNVVDGVSLAFTLGSDEDITYCLQAAPPLTYLIL